MVVDQTVTQRPMIIYAMPRSRSLATLVAAQRLNIYPEPFSFFNLLPDQTEQLRMLYEHASRLVPADAWHALADGLLQSDSASKIFGYHLHEFRPARDWWHTAQQVGDVFVLSRDREEICRSYFSAVAFGFKLRDEIAKQPVELPTWQIHHLDYVIDCHVRYMPSQGRLITWDNLPPSHFDKQLIDSERKVWLAEPQNGADNCRYIQNIDWLMQRAREVLERHQAYWDAKENALEAA